MRADGTAEETGLAKRFMTHASGNASSLRRYGMTRGAPTCGDGDRIPDDGASPAATGRTGIESDVVAP
jgi:hypothetical protein